MDGSSIKQQNTFQFTISPYLLTLQVNNKHPRQEFDYSQIERLSLSPFVDGLQNQVCKLSLVNTASKKVFSIKILNQTALVMDFLHAWEKAHTVEIQIIYKNGLLHTLEHVGESIAGFSKSSNIARIDLINPMCKPT